MLSLQAVYHYKIASLFPVDATATYAEISGKCGLNEVDLRRLLRHAMTNHVFEERDGRVAHTAASRLLAENTTTRDIVGIMCEEMFPGATRVRSDSPGPVYRADLSPLDNRCAGEIQPSSCSKRIC